MSNEKLSEALYEVGDERIFPRKWKKTTYNHLNGVGDTMKAAVFLVGKVCPYALTLRAVLKQGTPGQQ